MAVARTSLLDLPIITTGTEAGLWGDYTNNGLTEYLDIAIGGVSPLTSANFTAGALTIETTEGTNSATNIVATSAQYATFRVSSLAQNSTITVGNTGSSLGRSYRLINDDSTYTLTFKATGQTGVTLQPGQTALVAYNGTDYALVGTIGPTVPVARGGTGATTLTANNVILGNGTSAVQFVAPGSSGNVLTSDGTTWTSTAGAVGDVTAAGNNAFTGANTFYNATGQTFAPASTNDGIIVLGRAGGSSSYRVTLAPTTLSASRTLTLPDANTTVPVATQVLTFSGPTAARTYTLPDEACSVGFLNIPQNEQTGSYTLVAADSGKHIYRGSGSSATWTIPANSSVAYVIGTALTFINLSATSVSIAITSDTMYLSSAGTTGTRTLAQYGSATAIKIASTTWIISGSGLT